MLKLKTDVKVKSSGDLLPELLHEMSTTLNVHIAPFNATIGQRENITIGEVTELDASGKFLIITVKLYPEYYELPLMGINYAEHSVTRLHSMNFHKFELIHD